MKDDLIDQLTKSASKEIKGEGPNRFLLKHGKFWTPSVKQLRWLKQGPPKLCYWNSVVGWKASGKKDRPRLWYCEGLATSFDFPLFPHAWLADAEGRAFDPTWTNPLACVYFGIRFSDTAVTAHSLRGQGILWNHRVFLRHLERKLNMEDLIATD